MQMTLIKRPRLGRPLKYKEIIEALNPDELYSAAKIVRFAEATEMLVPHLEEDLPEDAAMELAKRRIRITLGRFSSNRGFPRRGDGTVRLKGQPPVRGWYGRRWQENTLETRG